MESAFKKYSEKQISKINFELNYNTNIVNENQFFANLDNWKKNYECGFIDVKTYIIEIAKECNRVKKQLL